MARTSDLDAALAIFRRAAQRATKTQVGLLGIAVVLLVVAVLPSPPAPLVPPPFSPPPPAEPPLPPYPPPPSPPAPRHPSTPPRPPAPPAPPRTPLWPSPAPRPPPPAAPQRYVELPKRPRRASNWRESPPPPPPPPPPPVPEPAFPPFPEPPIPPSPPPFPPELPPPPPPFLPGVPVAPAQPSPPPVPPTPPPPLQPPPLPPPAPPRAPGIGHRPALLPSLGKVEAVFGDAEDDAVFQDAVQRRSFNGEVILIVANEHNIQFALNLIFNLKEHGMDHYLLIATSSGMCSHLRDLSARTNAAERLSYTPPPPANPNATASDPFHSGLQKGLSCLHTSALLRDTVGDAALNVRMPSRTPPGEQPKTRLPTDLANHRLTALRGRYLMKLVDAGLNVLSVEPVTHFAKDPYVVFKKEVPGWVRLFMSTDACSLTDASECCDGAPFPCMRDGVIYAQHVRRSDDSKAYAVLRDWAAEVEQLYLQRLTFGQTYSEGAGPEGHHDPLDKALVAALVGGVAEDAHGGAAWRSGSAPLNISGDPRVLGAMPHGPARAAREEALEGLQLLHPAQFSPMRQGNREWVLREVDKTLARRLVGATYVAEDTLAEKRLLLRMHGWWHPQAEALEVVHQYGRYTRMLALHPGDRIADAPAEQWKAEAERLVAYAALSDRTAVLPPISCAGYAERGWTEREVLLAEVGPHEFVCHYNIPALHGERSVPCSQLLSAVIFRDRPFRELGFGVKQAPVLDLLHRLEKAQLHPEASFTAAQRRSPATFGMRAQGAARGRDLEERGMGLAWHGRGLLEAKEKAKHHRKSRAEYAEEYRRARASLVRSERKLELKKAEALKAQKAEGVAFKKARELAKRAEEHVELKHALAPPAPDEDPDVDPFVANGLEGRPFVSRGGLFNRGENSTVLAATVAQALAGAKEHPMLYLRKEGPLPPIDDLAGNAQARVRKVLAQCPI